MKKVCKIFLVVVIFIFVIVGYCLVQTKAKIDAMQFQTIDVSSLSDGRYTGTCDAFLVFVEVEVDIRNHKLQNITLLQHDNGLGKEAEKMLPAMIKANTTEVDTITSATISSKTMRCAVESALQ